MEREPSNRSAHVMNMHFNLTCSQPVQQVRDKKSTISEILLAAKGIIIKHGLSALKINVLSRESKKSKSCIYNSFLDIKGVLKYVIMDSDPWLRGKEKFLEQLKLNPKDYGLSLSINILQNHFINFQDADIAQIVALNELSQDSHPITKDISALREKLAKEFFQMSDPHFKNTNIDIRIVLALLIGGINYLSLHKKSQDITFCEIDIHKQKDDIVRTIGQIIDWTYKAALKQKNTSKLALILYHLFNYENDFLCLQIFA